MNRYGLVFATTSNGAFSLRNGLGMPWKRNSLDLKIFKALTLNTNVVMGRRTMESLGKPLTDRKNWVITSGEPLEGFYKTSFEEIKKSELGTVWFIGGKGILHEAINNFKISSIVHNEIIENIVEEEVTYFYNPKDRLPTPLNKLYEFSLNDNLKCHIWGKQDGITKLDKQYLDKMVSILNSDEVIGRNGVVKSNTDDTFVITADFSDGFPIIQSKFTWMKGIKTELDFFMAGETDTKILEAQGNNIWKGNTSKEFLESRGLPYEEGDMGPMYGFNWRHFGAVYEGAGKKYEGYDQYEALIEGLVNDPNSRRHLITTYDPSTTHQGVLAPCHGLTTQFFVRDNKISLKTYQRSADWFLGVPFNISSYALFLKRVVDEVNLKSSQNYEPSRVSIIFGDAHLYESHYVPAIETLVYSNFQDYNMIELDENENLIGYEARRVKAPMVA